MHHRPSRPASSRSSSSAALIGALVLVVALLLSPPAFAGHRPDASRYLLVADAAAETVLVYRTSDNTLTGRLDDVVLAAHAGAITLTDGRVVFVDDKHGRVLKVRIGRDGSPKVVGDIKIPGETWDGAAWATVDVAQRYYAVTSDDGATVVDLETHKVARLPVTRDPEPDGTFSELHPYLAGDPLRLVLTTGGRFTAYDVADVMDDSRAAPSSTAPAAAGPHGPVLAKDGSRVYATNSDGLGSAGLEGPLLTQPRQIAYSDTVDVVRSSRPRISLDGKAIYGAAPLSSGPAPAPEAWAQTENVISAFDLEEGSSSLYPLADGIVGRSAISKPYALLPVIGADGDAAYLFDVDPASAAYRTISKTIPLPALSKGPVAGQTAVGSERRFGTITSAGDLAYVTQGGDGTISVIDTAEGAISSTIHTPTALAGGGYLVTVERGVPLSDHHAR